MGLLDNIIKTLICVSVVTEFIIYLL